MTKSKRTPKAVLKLPDLEQSKSAVLNSLTSPSSQRSYDHAIREFIEWYCSEPRLAFNKTVVTRYRISLEQRNYALLRNFKPLPLVPSTEISLLPALTANKSFPSLLKVKAP
jgi:hypothetical protein